MPLFRRSKCGCIENTATSNYWSNEWSETPQLCLECDPEIGRWHDRFPKEKVETDDPRLMVNSDWFKGD